MVPDHPAPFNYYQSEPASSRFKSRRADEQWGEPPLLTVFVNSATRHCGGILHVSVLLAFSKE